MTSGISGSGGAADGRPPLPPKKAERKGSLGGRSISSTDTDERGSSSSNSLSKGERIKKSVAQGLGAARSAGKRLGKGLVKLGEHFHGYYSEGDLMGSSSSEPVGGVKKSYSDGDIPTSSSTRARLRERARKLKDKMKSAAQRVIYLGHSSGSGSSKSSTTWYVDLNGNPIDIEGKAEKTGSKGKRVIDALKNIFGKGERLIINSHRSGSYDVSGRGDGDRDSLSDELMRQASLLGRIGSVSFSGSDDGGYTADYESSASSSGVEYATIVHPKKNSGKDKVTKDTRSRWESSNQAFGRAVRGAEKDIKVLAKQLAEGAAGVVQTIKKTSSSSGEEDSFIFSFETRGSGGVTIREAARGEPLPSSTPETIYTEISFIPKSSSSEVNINVDQGTIQSSGVRITVSPVPVSGSLVTTPHPRAQRADAENLPRAQKAEAVQVSSRGARASAQVVRTPIWVNTVFSDSLPHAVLGQAQVISLAREAAQELEERGAPETEPQARQEITLQSRFVAELQEGIERMRERTHQVDWRRLDKRIGQ